MGNLSALANTVVQTTPVGVIEAFAGVNAPAGWLFCDGSAISRIQYPELFSALGTTYGSGDGSTTFNLPDLRGRMPFGKGTHADVASLGQNEGASLANRRPKHQHTVYDPNHSHQQYLGWSGSGNVLPYWDGNTSRGIYGGGNTGPTSTGIKINPEGASSSSSPQDAPPYLVVNYIIKAVADLPRGGWFYQNSPPVVTQLPSNPQIGEEVYMQFHSTGRLNLFKYDGTAWRSTTGLVHIATNSFSNAGGPFLDGVFSDYFDNYKVEWSLIPNGGGFVGIRFRNNGSEISSGYSWVAPWASSAAGVGNGVDRSNSDARIAVGYGNNGAATSGSFDIFNPYLTRSTIVNGIAMDDRQPTHSVQTLGSGLISNSTRYNGITMYMAAVNITGTMTVYGYAK